MFDDAKSLFSLYNTLSLSPGGLIVIVDLTSEVNPTVAVTPLPRKSSCVILLRVPTRLPSSNILIEPGINPP